MTLDIEERYIKRYDASVNIFEQAAETMGRTMQENLELVDLSNRLIITPTFIWDKFFNSGLSPELFWEKGIEAYELTSRWGFAFSKFNNLIDACEPSSQRATDISLNGTIYKGDSAFYHVFGHLGDHAEKSLHKLPNSAADIVLSSLSTEDVQLARYNLRFIKGRGKYPFNNLVDGGVQYFLPTILDGVQACLTYPSTNKSPIVSLRVNPL